ncbi:hypothetical protein IJ556_07005 [bacterium]|nr:hypothetical protein [bacterium]MBR2273638.1 hypothetical protein [Alphaproteobacteria bacterium]
MEQKEKMVQQLQTMLRAGGKIPSLTQLLSREEINYDLVEAALYVRPQLINEISCKLEDGHLLCYEVPPSLHRDLQEINSRAFSIVLCALPQEDFETVVYKFGRNRRQLMRDVYKRFQESHK